MAYEGIVDELTMSLPNAGILPFNDLESASELDEIYERVLPFETESNCCFNPYFKNGELLSRTQGIQITLINLFSGNWFAAAVKRRRRAEIKASKTNSLDISCILYLPIELLLEVRLRISPYPPIY